MATPAGNPAALAARHGLTPPHLRPGPLAYARQLWRWRRFAALLSTTAAGGTGTAARRWDLLAPLLNAGLYYVLYGLLLGEDRGHPYYVPFVALGAVVFTFTQTSVRSGTSAVSGNLDLVRALRFPRGCLPLAAVLGALRQLGTALAVLLALMAAGGLLPLALAAAPAVRWPWLLAVPALALQAVFNAGLALAAARLGARAADAAVLAPFAVRVWQYACGTGYSLGALAPGVPHLARLALEADPPAVYLGLVRGAVLGPTGARGLPPHAWPLAAGWAALSGMLGFLYFWRGEGGYGRG